MRGTRRKVKGENQGLGVWGVGEEDREEMRIRRDNREMKEEIGRL